MERRKSKKIKCGNIFIGGDAPISIQSMTNTKTSNILETVAQIRKLEIAGAEIVRIAIPDEKSAMAISEIKKKINIPLVADIHFDYKLAILAMENGIDKLRLNPGNIGSIDRISKVVKVALDKQIPIRIGVNSGSLEKDILEKYGKVTADGLYESAIRHIRILEDLGFYDILVSIKASNIEMTLEAFEKLALEVDYPFHIGITEAGTILKGTVKSSIGIGALLLRGIGDTIRVSLTADPVEEIPVCKSILSALSLRKFGVNLVSCPTCGRTQTKLIELAETLEKALENVNKDITVAVMGCAVNGPGEAREADFGVACGKESGLIFKKGEIVKKVHENEIVEVLLSMINEY